MGPRRRLINVGAGLLALIGSLAASESKPARAGVSTNERPNILLVITDDQRSGHDAMPAVRRWIVRQGKRFDNAFATTPSCCPSRATIFTGLYSHNHGVLNNESASALNPSTTVQFHLDQTGYRTGIIGKYLNKWWKAPELNPPPDFDKYAVVRGGREDYYYDGKWNIDGNIRTVPDYSTTFIEERAVRQLKEWEEARDARPWFLVLAPTAPHGPSTTLWKYRGVDVPEYFPPVEEDKSDKPPYVQETFSAPWKGNRLQMKERRALLPVDDMVGHVMRQLNRRDELANTLVIYISDNAVMWEEHGLPYKGIPYTEDLKVPLFMRWDGRVSEGTLDDRLIGNVDIAPTILDAAGMDDDVWNDLDGKSLLNTSWIRERLHLEYLSDHRKSGAWAATRAGDYQYTEYYDEQGEISFREYYDLEADALQMTNLLSDEDLLNDPPTSPLEAQLEDDRNCAGSDCP